MTDETPQINFIRSIIDADRAAGKNGGRVATRFPPEPNGYLHIGHAKSICLNFGIAEDYDGTCNLRFDDTNPHKENQAYVNAIMEDVRWLGYEWGDRLFFASDYFEQLYAFAVELIERGKAYVCDLTLEEIRAYRGTLTEPGRESPYRPHAGGRVPRRLQDAAGTHRHGFAKHQHAGCRHLPDQSRCHSSPDWGRVVRLPHV